MAGKTGKASNLSAAVMILISVSSHAETKNGFVIDDALVGADRIFQGGPARDGIPAIDNPVLISSKKAEYIQDDERILGIVHRGTARAYPVKILNWHEIVNDTIEDLDYTVTYCPLCGTGVAFNRRVHGDVLVFGVSGLLYNSDVLLFDRDTESLWSQIIGKAISGAFKGTALEMLPLTHTTWSDWKQRYPESTVLSEHTGFGRNYARNPYAGYESNHDIHFPVTVRAPRNYHPKERVLGLSTQKAHKAYPFIELNKHGQSEFNDTLDGKTFTIHWDMETQSGYITDSENRTIPTMQAYWFAWYAFHPDTKIFVAITNE